MAPTTPRLVALAAALAASSASAQKLSPRVPLPGDLSIAQAIGTQDDPVIAPGNGQYLVVYEDERVSRGATVGLDPWEVIQTDLYATRLDTSGAVLDPSPIVVDSSAYSQENPSAAWNGTSWLVAYESRSVIALGTATDVDIHAVRVSSTGEVLDGVPIVLESGDIDAYRPTVGSDGTNWVVLWTESGKLYGSVVDPNGVPDRKVQLTSTGYTYDSAIGYAQGRFLIAWEGGIQAQLFDASLNPLSTVKVLSNFARDADPVIATDGIRFFVAWTYADSYWPAVRGTPVLVTGEVPYPGGLQLDAGTFSASSGPGLVWTGSHYVVAWTDSKFDPRTFQSRISVVFVRVDDRGTVLGAGETEIQGSTAYSSWRPVASSLGAGDTLVGWMDTSLATPLRREFDGHLSMVDHAGVPGPIQPYTVAPPAQLTPGLAEGTQGSQATLDVNLLVFVSADATETRVVYQRVDGLGNVLDTEPVVIAGGSQDYQNTAVAWNGSVWLVVWEKRIGGLPSGQILGSRVRPDGTVLDPLPFPIVSGNTPDVASVEGRFLVVSSDEPIDHLRYIRAQRVGNDGSLLGSSLFVGGSYSVSPAVAGFDDGWVVSWQQHVSHDSPYSTIQANLVSAAGVASGTFAIANSSATERTPDVIVAGGLATFAWTDGDNIRTRQMQPDGVLLGPSVGTLATSGVEETAPTLAWDGACFTLTSVDYRAQFFLEPLLGDLYGTTLDIGLVPSTLAGIPIASSPIEAEGESALLGTRRRTIVAYPAVLANVGNWRVSTCALVEGRRALDRRASGPRPGGTL